MNVEGIAAIVTGGASGLGLATARHLASLGAKVAVMDRDAEAGAAIAEEIGALFLQVDVCSEDDVENAVVIAEDRHGVARVLVNCAGISDLIPVIGSDGKPHSVEAFRRIMDINLVGSFNVLIQFAARLAAAEPVGEERGVIVNTSSIASFDGLAGQAAYGASKAAINGMLLPLARDLAPHLIRVVAIAPGVFLSPMVEALPADYKNALAAQVPHPRRLGQPEEFARFVRSAIESPMLNGTVVRLDGACRLG